MSSAATLDTVKVSVREVCIAYLIDIQVCITLSRCMTSEYARLFAISWVCMQVAHDVHACLLRMHACKKHFTKDVSVHPVALGHRSWYQHNVVAHREKLLRLLLTNGPKKRGEYKGYWTHITCTHVNEKLGMTKCYLSDIKWYISEQSLVKRGNISYIEWIKHVFIHKILD